MMLFTHETTRSLFHKTLGWIKIQRCAEMWNHDIQDICTKAKGKLDLLFEACCMRIHNISGLKDIFDRL